MAIYEVMPQELAKVELSDTSDPENGWTSSFDREFEVCRSRAESIDAEHFVDLRSALQDPQSIMRVRETDWNDQPGALISGPHLLVRYVYVIEPRRLQLYALQEWHPPF
ncbi:hypothetical protein [Terricaulis silvestris]|uniref:hypothetical protein n=1 Tax=Terricaulis silvestris TaxID=2686094 RepID=UPI00131CAF2E|nr:hypothetical protein [Terricaulis silvestris]